MVATARLDEVATLNPRPTTRPSNNTTISFLGMADVGTDGSTTEGNDRPFGEVAKGYTYFERGDVLVAKITPCFENGKIAEARTRHIQAAGSTEFHVIRPNPGVLDGRYLHHYLRQPLIRVEGERRMTGSGGQRRVPESYLAQLQIPVPPIDEQQRIAEILDQADELRVKRRRSIGLLHELAQSIFYEMFGTREFASTWPIEPLSAHLTEPSRNGLSPSSKGKVQDNVLTLSAITGSTFDETAIKSATFTERPPKTKRVNSRDFLICRGNGNLRLVGLGTFPKHDMPHAVFPDTMIAIRVDHNTISREYLEYVWRTEFVRGQIESAARTTNGTFKINQKVIHALSLPVPPIEIQKDFGLRVRAIETVREVQQRHLAKLDELFVSLQNRAFRGEL